MSFHRVVFSSLLSLSLLAVPVLSIGVPSGNLRPDNLDDFAPHPQIGKTFNEFWTYTFWLNNGISVEVNLSRASFGSFKDPVCGANLSATNFKGKNYLVAREYKSSNFAFDRNSYRLSIHERIFSEGRPPESHRLFFATTKKGTSYFLDLTFKEMAQGSVWGDGVFQLPDNQKVALFFHVPRARVQGRLAIDNDTLAVQGWGWMDHTWQTHFAPKLIDAGYRYVVPGRVEGGFFFRRDGNLFGYGLREENGKRIVLHPTGIRTLEKTSWAGINLPLAFEIDFNGAPAVRYRWKEQRQSNSAFQELSSFERWGAKLYIGGDLYGFRGTGTVNDSLPAVFSFTGVKR
jgi:predicted secreted hydrolase